MEVILNRRFVSRQIHLTLADEVGEKLDGIVKRYRFRNLQAALGVLISRFCKHVEVQECTRVPVRLSIEDEIDDMFNELERLHIMPETTLPPRSHRTRPMDRSGRAVRVIDAEAVEVSEEVVLPSVRDIEKALALPENALAENGLAEKGVTDGGLAEGALSEVPEVPEDPEKSLAEGGPVKVSSEEVEKASSGVELVKQALEKGAAELGKKAFDDGALVPKKKGGKK